MQGRVVFPLQDEDGRLVGYAGRSVDGREPRYLFPPGFHTSQVVFNFHRAVTSQRDLAIVVEGFFDCLKVYQAGYDNVVALMGVSASARQSQLLQRRFRELLLMLDGDETGRRAGRARACSALGSQPDQLSSREIQGILRAF